MLRLILLALLCATPTLSLAGPIDDATSAYASGDYAKVLKIVRPLAEKGDPDAQKLLGRLYGLGKGVPRDFILGCMWQNLAASQQHEEDTSCMQIAHQLTPEEALKWSFRPEPDAVPAPSTASPVCAGADPSCERIARYINSSSDAVVSGSMPLTVLRGSVEVKSSSPRTILLAANGTVAPSGPVQGRIQIILDGKPLGSAPTFDWRNSPAPATRSFNTFVAVDLTPGLHTVAVAAQLLRPAARTSMTVAAGTSLSVLSSTARSVQSVTLAKDTPSYSTKSRGISVTPFASVPLAVASPSLSFLSANVYGDAGDAMVGLSPDGAVCPWTGEQSWAVQDMANQAEREAPMFVQASSLGSPEGAKPTALAAVFPWVFQDMLDPVHYRITKGTTLVSLEQPRISGTGYVDGFRNVPCATIFYHCFASSHGYDFCPKIGERSIVARTRVTIDENSDGVLMIVASTLPTADHDDGGGSAQLGLRIDGVDVGTAVTQALPRASVESARVLTVNYLADSEHPLSKGAHTIEAWMSAANGSDFKWISIPNSLVLSYFD